MSTQENAHLDPGALVGFEQGQLNAQEAAAVQAHLDSCGRCGAELALVRSYLSVPEDAVLDEGRSDVLRESFAARLNVQVQQNASDRDASRSRTVRSATAPGRSRSARRWALGGLIAASLALIVVAAGLLTDGLIYSGGGTQLRSTSDGQWAQGLVVEALEGGEWQLSWPEHPEAREYRVIFLDQEGVSAYQTVTTVPSLRVDPGTIEALSGEGKYFAVVEFIRRSGETQRSAPRVLPAP